MKGAPDGTPNRYSNRRDRLLISNYLFQKQGLSPSPLRPGVVTRGIAPLVVPHRIQVQSRQLRRLLVAITLFKELQAFLPLLCRNPLFPEGLAFLFHSLPPRKIMPAPARQGRNRLSVMHRLPSAPRPSLRIPYFSVGVNTYSA